MESSEIAQPVNQFGFRVLASLIEQEEMESVLVAPPALFLGLALLKSAASGATRSGLARFLGTDEALQEEERDRRVRHLREVVQSSGGGCLENVLRANSHRPLSPSFVRRATGIYGVQVEQDESSLPLRLQSTFQAQLAATRTIHSLRENRCLAVRYGTNNPRHALYVFLPDRVPFWQGRKKALSRLLGQIHGSTWPTWQSALSERAPEMAWAFPDLTLSGSITLKSLELGPASTVAADFSRLMVSGNAPHLSTLRHQAQLSFDHEREIPATAPLLPDQPLVWVLSDEPSGIIVLMGVKP